MKLKLLGVYIVAGIIGLGGVAQADLSNGLVAYYPFNGNANDESGVGNHGIVDGAKLSEDRFGNADSAYNFSTYANKIRIQHDSSLAITEDITISAWVYQDAGGSGFIVAKADGIGYAAPYHFTTSSNTEAVHFYMGDGSSQQSIATASNAYSDEIWHHLVALREGNNVSIYIDGVSSEVSSSMTNTPVDNGTDVYIGNWSNNDALWEGSLDDIRIYNRALSESEIQELYTENEINCSASNPASIGLNLDISIPSAEYKSFSGTSDLWVDLEFKGTDEDGDMVWKLSDYGSN